MKKNLYPIVLSFGLAVFSLSACGQNAHNMQGAENTSASQAAPAVTVQEGAETAATESPMDGGQTDPAAPTDSTQAELPSGAQSGSATSSQGNSAGPSLTGAASVPQETLPAEGLSEAEAKAAALEHAGVAEADTTGMLVKLEMDDGILQYDVEFYAGDMEYDYEINATTGEILGFDHEWDHDHHSQAGAAGNSAEGGQFTQEQAIALALSQVSGATQDHITQFKTDYDEGRLIYEIEIRYNNTECELEIDANTGQILELDFDD